MQYVKQLKHYTMSENDKFDLANDVNFLIAIENAQNNKPLFQTRPFMSIGDRIILITELEKQGFTIVKI